MSSPDLIQITSDFFAGTYYKHVIHSDNSDINAMSYNAQGVFVEGNSLSFGGDTTTIDAQWFGTASSAPWTLDLYILWSASGKKPSGLSNFTVGYGSEEVGSWTFDGETYTKRKLVTINQSSGSTLTGYQVPIDYNQISDTEILITNESAGGGGGNKSITVTQLTPSNGLTTYNKEQNFSYSISLVNVTNASVELWLDSVLQFNDSVTTDTTLSHIINNTYGVHSWYVYAREVGNTTDDTSATRTFNVTFNPDLYSPADGTEVYQKEVNFTYGVNTSLDTIVMLFADGINIHNDTINGSPSIINYSLDHLYNLSGHGNYTWYVRLEEAGNSSNYITSDVYEINVSFDLSLLSPSNNQLISGDTVFLQYFVNTTLPTNCTLYIDGNAEFNDVMNTTQTINNTFNTTSGNHTWRVNCSGVANPAHSKQTSTLTFYLNWINYENIINLTSTAENVLDYSQILFYDVSGFLSTFYYADYDGDRHARSQRIVNGVVTADYELVDNSANPINFSIIYREPPNIIVSIFDSALWSNDYYMNTTSIGEGGTQHKLNATANNIYNPYNYAYTKHFENDDLDLIDGTSYYLFLVPTTENTTIAKKYTNNGTIIRVDTLTNDIIISFQTLANNENLTEWYYVAPKFVSAAYVNPALYLYDGSTSTEIKQFWAGNVFNSDFTDYTFVSMERYENSTYVFISLTDLTIHRSFIYQVETDDLYTLSTTQNLFGNISDVLFVDNETFVFMTDSDTIYSCYFDGSGSCLTFSATSYGVTMPYQDRGFTTATKRENDQDTQTIGTIISNTTVQLSYTTREYDVKYRCFDEMNETRNQFTLQTYSESNSIILSTNVWGYVLSSEDIGPGVKRSYSYCTDGTQRLFIVGLNSNYKMDLYSLHTSLGQYYTFTVQDNFGQALSNVTISAYRFSNQKQAWVVIEQGITDYTGSATLFLEPFVLYKLILEKDGYVTIDTDFVPATITSIEVTLNNAGGAILTLPTYSYMWDDVSFTLTPDYSFSTNATNTTYTVSSGDSMLQYWGMQVTRYVNGSGTIVYSNNLTTPTGGTMSYEMNQNGTYHIDVWFKHQNYSMYSPLTKIFRIGPESGFTKAMRDFNIDQPIGGWTFFLIGVVLAMVAGGFVSRYTVEGAGVVSLLIIWGFALFNPSVELVCMAGLSGVCLTPVIAAIITTVGVISAMYLMRVGT
jgi:hypothetical protein